MQNNVNNSISHWQQVWLNRFWQAAPMLAIARRRLQAMQAAQHVDIKQAPHSAASYCPHEAQLVAQRVYDFYHHRCQQAFEHLAALDLVTLDELTEMQAYL